MSHFTPRSASPLPRRQRPGGRGPRALAGTAAIVVVAAGLAVAAGAGGDGSGEGGLERTGEINAMGMPVMQTPGAGRGTVRAAGVVVDEASWDLGRVPLDVAVRPTWTLRNTGTEAVTLGEPHPEVREGCCPGPLVLGERALAPGAATTLTFELSMHPGMDGPHDLGIHVPIEDGSAAGEYLTLEVTGDFGG